MKTTRRAPTPVNIIAGPLGVGKTTVINHLLMQRPQHEKWAVLVNEYGLIGLDAALMDTPDSAGKPGVVLREVAGGCICCSAGLMFEVALVRLLRKRPDRLLIEPTGLAALSGILDTLERPGIRDSVDVRTIVCLLNPERFREDAEREHVADQIAAADVVLGSRADLASAESLSEFDDWARALFPPKKAIRTIANGAIELSLLDMVAQRRDVPHRGGHTHGTDHHHHHAPSVPNEAPAFEATTMEEGIVDAEHPILCRVHDSSETSTVGWVCWSGLVFDDSKALVWLRELAALSSTQRVKAVLRTSIGWHAFNLADGVTEMRSSAHRRDSRLELIIDGGNPHCLKHLEQQLRECLVDPSQQT